MDKISKFRIDGRKKFKIEEYQKIEKLSAKDEEEAIIKMDENKEKISKLQDKLYASNKYGILLIFQAMDAAGKDSTIKHVLSGINPQGFQVFNFKQPNSEEIDHDYLWRTNKALPERGRIGVFNRSYYEEVLVVKVHNLLEKSSIPKEYITKDVWDKRYKHIRNMENYLIENGIIPIKIFLNVSKEEQKKRFLERIENPEKNWKFASGDVMEREYWQDYQNAYEDAINNTSTENAPWYAIPADKKWYARYQVSKIVLNVLESLKLEYPVLSDEEKAKLEECKNILLSENSTNKLKKTKSKSIVEIDTNKKKKKHKNKKEKK